jgi:DNA-binding NarL/FixJ family response regulator
MKQSTSRFLILSQDKQLIRAFASALPKDATLQAVDGFQDLFPLLRASDTQGVVIDGQGTGSNTPLEIARVRHEVPLAQLLFVAVDLRAQLLNDLQPLRVDILARPFPLSAFSTFIKRALTAGRVPTASVNAYIDQLASAHKLSGREVSLFSVVLENETVEAACARLGLNDEVFTRTMRRLLKKCHMRSRDRLAKSVMRDALLSTSALTAPLVEPLRPASGF